MTIRSKDSLVNGGLKKTSNGSSLEKRLNNNDGAALRGAIRVD